MDIPNPYLGNYKVLILIPLILVAISIYFIPHIQKGVEFQGGTLVTMQSNQSMDTALLTSELTARGYTVASVQSLPNPSGYDNEVEIERDTNLTLSDNLKDDFFANLDNASQLEAIMASSNNSAGAVANYTVARNQLDKDANGLFAIEGASQNASSYADTNDLSTAVSSAYRAINDNYSAKLTAVLSSLVPYQSASFEEVSASLSQDFISQAITVVIYSTVLVCIVVFIIFRTAVPSLAVLTGAASDVLIALGAMGLFGIPLTLASFAALLMLVGFSLDTDVLLTMRVIKRREGTARERAYDAMKTGMTMSAALMLSFICLFILASITHIDTYFQISAVALAGLIGDLIATWLFNAIIVLYYVERGGTTGEGGKTVLSSIFSN
jgi:preprotein translocase subunit SecF